MLDQVKIDRDMIADRYRTGNCEAAFEAAKQIPRFTSLCRNFELTRHGACFNSIMDNAIGSDSMPIWLAFCSPKNV